MRTGIANLPLHPGKCPRWLFPRMVKLAGAITEVIIDEYGTGEMLKRLSNPYWFQGFGCVLGFDWHSSGLTTTTCGALKEALNRNNFAIKAAGGKGKQSTKTQEELSNSELSSSKIEKLKHASKIAAKVDNSMVQDGYALYHHLFVYDEKGRWSIIQQGMNSINKYARRYHWLSENLTSLIEEPHTAICCNKSGKTLNLSSKQSRETRKISLDLVKDNVLGKSSQRTISEFLGFKESVLNMTPRHWIKDIDLSERDKQVLRKAYELQPESYEELISLKGMGAKKLRALALVSDLVYGTKSSWKDPVKYSFSHGGKDGTPFPVDRKTYDNTINELKNAIDSAKIGNSDKLKAIKRLQTYIKI